MAASEINKIQPEDTGIPQAVTGAYTARIPQSCIALLVLAHPLGTAPYMLPAASYTLLSSRFTAWNWDYPLAPLMTWLRASLYQAFLGVNSLPPLELDDHITISRKTLYRQMVPSACAQPATLSPTYIVQQLQPSQATPAKNKNPAKRWDLQALSLSRIVDIQSPEDPTLIWHTLAPLIKEKACPAFKIACRESARALGCKAPRVTHTVSVLLLGIYFFTGDPDFVNDTVNIFQFPDLSLSAGSEALMVTRRCDTALEANTVISYVDAAALMKQKRILSIVVWEAAEKILEQWLVVVTVLIGPKERHPAVFELATLLEATDKVNSRLRAQAAVQQDILEALVRLIQTEFNEHFRQFFTSHLPVRWPTLLPSSEP